MDSFPAILVDPAAVRRLLPDVTPEEVLAGGQRANHRLYADEAAAARAIVETIQRSRAAAVSPEERTAAARESIEEARRFGYILGIEKGD